MNQKLYSKFVKNLKALISLYLIKKDRKNTQILLDYLIITYNNM